MRHKTEKMKLCEQGVIAEEALLAYLNNELTAEEKQELEKLLKEDPFAQEALEGLQETNKSNVATVVVSINKRVRERTGLKETRRINMHWSNYAWAAVVFGLLIGIGFLMVNYIGNQDSSIAMNKKAEESVNLMEQKVDEPNLVPVVTNTITDSLQQQVTTTENPLKPLAAPEAKQPDGNKSAEAESKNVKTGASGANLPPVTATGGAVAPPQPSYMNSTILADDKGTVTGKTTSTGLQKGKDEAAGGARSASGDAERPETKPAAKEESMKKNAQQRKEDNAPASETIVRGAIVEKVPADKVTVISMDDAMKSFNTGDYKTSADNFNEILKQQPNNIDALYWGGISDYINGNTKKSEKNFDKLLKDGTKYVEGSKWYKANILLKKGKKEEAKKLLDELSNTSGSYKERAVKKKAEMEF